MDIRAEERGWGCILLAAACLVLPPDWVIAGLAAAVFHEICHVLAVLAQGGTILSLRMGLGGAELVSSPLPCWGELLAILAGPAGSLSLLLCREWVPQMALCGLIQGLYNLLPVFPLDGGRAVRCFWGRIWPDQAEGISRAVEKITVLSLLCAGFWGTFWCKLGIFPLLLALTTLFRVKNSCKDSPQRVQ